jgi:hypothetical protein
MAGSAGLAVVYVLTRNSAVDGPNGYGCNAATGRAPATNARRTTRCFTRTSCRSRNTDRSGPSREERVDQVENVRTIVNESLPWYAMSDL